MKKINNIESFNNEIETVYPGKCILVNLKTLLELESSGLVENSPENRRADESKWNNDNHRNFFERVGDESNNYKLYGDRDDYFSLMEPITLVFKDGKLFTDDGAHRFSVFGKLNDFDYSKNLLKDLPESSFFRTVVEDCVNGLFSDETIDNFNNCYIPIRFTNDNKIHYVGVNSAKTMKGQQISRVSFIGNEIFDYGQSCVRDASRPFNLTAVGNSSEETSTADTISLMALAGGDSKASRNKTTGYCLDKYSDSESIKKFISYYDRFLNIMSSKLEVFDFAFSKGKFKSIYMYGLIQAARDMAIEAYCDVEGTTYEFRMKEIKRDKEAFFNTLEGCLTVLESDKFSKIVERAKMNIYNIRIDSNATGSFSRGSSVRNAIFSALKADKNGKRIYPVKIIRTFC